MWQGIFLQVSIDVPSPSCIWKINSPASCNIISGPGSFFRTGRAALFLNDKKRTAGVSKPGSFRPGLNSILLIYSDLLIWHRLGNALDLRQMAGIRNTSSIVITLFTVSCQAVKVAPLAFGCGTQPSFKMSLNLS